jgi:hypothetical protein
MIIKPYRTLLMIMAVFLALIPEIAAAAGRSEGNSGSDNAKFSVPETDPSPQIDPQSTGNDGTSKTPAWPDRGNGSFAIAAGFGYAHAKAPRSGFKYNSKNYNYDSCTPNATDPDCVAMSGLDDLLISADFDYLYHHSGYEFNLSFLPAEKKTAGVKYQQLFFGINGIYAPINRERMVVKLMAGIGGSYTSFISISESMKNKGTLRWEYYAGAGIEIYVTKAYFLRPQFDFRYIPRFKEQFGSKIAPGFTLWIGIRNAV